MKDESTRPPEDVSLPPTARQAVADLRCRGPSNGALARMRASLGVGGPSDPPTGSDPSGGTEPTQSTAIESSGSMLGKALAVVAVGSVAAGIGWYAMRPSSPSTPALHTATASASTWAPEPPGSVEAESTAAPDAGAEAISSSQPPKRVASDVPSSASSNGPSETQLIGRAQMIVHTDPQTALRLCQEHARRYPNGMLAQEREVLTVEALKGIGRDKEASEASKSLLEKNPDTAHRNKLNVLVGDAGQPE